jgi:hypothetical protein
MKIPMKLLIALIAVALVQSGFAADPGPTAPSTDGSAHNSVLKKRNHKFTEEGTFGETSKPTRPKTQKPKKTGHLWVAPTPAPSATPTPAPTSSPGPKAAPQNLAPKRPIMKKDRGSGY